MNTEYKKTAGLALIIGSVFLIVTMALHPAGGSFEHLLKISKVIVTAHTIAILSIPINLVGFWGFKKSFTKAWGLPMLAFTTISVGHIAALIAAALNGLVLPIFINQYKEATPEKIAAIMPILKFNSALNHAFDYIFIGAMCIAVLLWSIAILITKEYPNWLAYLGILLNACFLAGLMFDFTFVNDINLKT